MSNPLVNQTNNIAGMLKQFNEFKSSMQGKNPAIVLEELTKSGRYTPEQIENAKQLANQFKNILH